MKDSARLRLLFVAVLLLFMAGCASNRGIVSIEQLSAPATSSPSNGKEVFVRSVNDIREFQENPKTQDIPSLGFGGSSAASVDIKKRAVARKRNTYGKALGDILLEEGQTVESIVDGTLKRTLGDMGYTVLKSEKEITPNTLVLDTSIQQFWAYMTPGFWAITLSCDISTKLEISQLSANTKETREIKVKSEGKYQTGAEGNWMEVIHKALGDYAEQVKARFSIK